MRRGIHLRLAALVLAWAVLVGCKATPAPSAGFADAKLMKPGPDVGFNKFWRKPGVEWSRYTQIYVADVNTAYMLKATDWQKGERKAEIERDVRGLAVRARETIIKAFRDDPRHRMRVVDQPTPDGHTLVLEAALVEIVPSKVVLNVLGYAPFFVGTGITVARTVTNDQSSAAFEARVRDARTHEILILAADREGQQVTIVNLRGLTWYGDIEGIIGEWSKQSVRLANAKPGEKVAAMETFRLLPW